MGSMAGSEDILHKGRLGRFAGSAARFTSSIDTDPRLLEAVIEINSAHVLMLLKQKIIDRHVARDLLSALRKVPKDLKLSEILEDVHMNVEDHVISSLGKDSGGMLNVAKSRNDQVATALRIVLREEILSIARALTGLESALLSQARQNASVVMPGFTHLQRAQPVTVGHHLLAHYDSLERDIDRLMECYHRVNMSPMGAGALASTGFDIDREVTASFLGFERLVENSIDAVSARDFAIESIYVCAQILADVSRFAEELVLWTSKEFSFAEIQDRYTSTSSMMPQKKNPVVPEIARAKAAQVIGDLVGSLCIVKSLPLGYNLDLQELTRNLWSSSDKTLDTLVIFGEMTRGVRFNKRALERAATSDESLYATELADYLVTKYGLSFRDAHSRVGALVKYSIDANRRFSSLSHGDLASMLRVPITKEEVGSLLDPHRVLSRRRAAGSPNPRLVLTACDQRATLLRRNLGKWGDFGRTLAVSKDKLQAHIERVIARKLDKSKRNKVSGKKIAEVKQ
ncbi:MAG: argininosuccinate lyase [Nitrososphaerales archaeon]